MPMHPLEGTRTIRAKGLGSKKEGFETLEIRQNVNPLILPVTGLAEQSQIYCLPFCLTYRLNPKRRFFDFRFSQEMTQKTIID